MYRTRRTLGVVFLLLFCFATTGVAQQAQPAQTQPSTDAQSQGANETLSPESEDRLLREVRHELIMLPYYGVFDNLGFRIDGRTVTLEGQVTQPVLRSDAEKAVKRIEGVEKVINNIDVLPANSMDDRTRRAVYRAIYSYGPLFKYGGMAVPPIHIIVKNGHVTLVGVVDSEADKNVAGIRANQVPGIFQVTNNLRVVSSGSQGKKK